MIGEGHARSVMPCVHVSTSLLATPEWLLTTASSRGHWVALLGFCARAENGGSLSGAKRWAAAQWSVVLGPGGSRAAVDALVDEGLATWTNDSLIVGGYPSDAEAAYRAQRSGGRKRAAGRKAGETRPEGTTSLDGIRSKPTRLPPRLPPRLPGTQSTLPQPGTPESEDIR
jgi:hypothetical protein